MVKAASPESLSWFANRGQAARLRASSRAAMTLSWSPSCGEQALDEELTAILPARGVHGTPRPGSPLSRRRCGRGRDQPSLLIFRPPRRRRL